jgi:hypothetical protein
MSTTNINLLRLVESYTTSIFLNERDARSAANDLWGDKPVLVIPNHKKKSSWTHMIWARGPASKDESLGTQLVVIWWSEFEPDTARVLAAIDWEKNAKDF